jgi:ABC-type branched-subunit amino acid transport system substrate-binding protein
MRVLVAIFFMVALHTASALVPGMNQLINTAWAKEEQDKDELSFGMSTALSGPVAGLGRAMKDGVELAFAEANAKGGMHGRRLRLIALDDSYHPPTAAANVERLIEQDRVLAIVGNLGTPTARLAMPLATEAGVLFFGAMTGADLLRANPPNRYVINFRASYAQEVKSMLDLLLAEGIQPEEIAFFTQDDSYGASVYESAMRQLETRGYAKARSLAHGRYPRNTLQVEAALVALIEAPVRPRAVIMVGAFRPSAKFILLARQIFPDMVYLNVSFVGSGPLKDLLKESADPLPETLTETLTETLPETLPQTLTVKVMEVVPPLDADLPAVRAFHDARAQWKPDMDASAAALEGYLAARVLLLGLEAAPAPTREDLINALLNMGQIDLGMGAPLYLSPAQHQASQAVWPVNLLKPTIP